MSAAIALARANYDVTLLERADVIGEVGAGLQLSPNATRILNEWGVLARLGSAVSQPEALRIRRARDGEELMRMPLGPVAESRWGSPHLVVHRADLQRGLLEVAATHPTIRIETGVQVLGFAGSSSGVEVGARRHETPLRYDADVLIGADGVRSLLRDKLSRGSAERLVWSGRTAWRALVDAEKAPAMANWLETNLWLGTRCHLVHYPLRRGSLINVVAITQDGWRGNEADDFWSAPGKTEDVLARFSNWSPDAQALIAAAHSWKRWPLFDTAMLPQWSDGRVTLLGDSAHPMLPFMAQGTAQAMEDAAALGASLAGATSSEIKSRLAVYERERIPRTAAVQLASRRQGKIYHLSGIPALARDQVLRRMGPGRMMQQLDWIYGYRGPMGTASRNVAPARV